MNLPRIGLGAGTAVTTFLVTAAVTIEALGGGEAPALGILGVFAGVVAGLLAALLVGASGDRLAGVARAALAGYATLGPVFVAIAALSYLNVPGADTVFGFPVNVGTSVAVAAAVALFVAFRGRNGRPAAA